MAHILQQTYEPAVPLDKLQLASVNPRQGDIGAIHESIEHNGFYGAVIANRATGRILAGNHRYLAAQTAGLDALPVLYVEAGLDGKPLSDEAALRLLLVDNRSNDLASYDNALLADLLQGLAQSDAGLQGTGYDGDALDELLADLEMLGSNGSADPGAEVDRAAELQQTWGTERGQLWQIGRHFLLCGDATDAGDVERLLAGKTPYLMVTDPPYGVEYDASWRNEVLIHDPGRRVRDVMNDDRIDWSEAIRLFPGDILYMWSSSDHIIRTGRVILDCGYKIRNEIIWAKPHYVVGQGHYSYQHEPLWYAVRKGKKSHWIGPKNESTRWDIALDANVEGGHSTQKPLECMQRPIRNHAGDVYDPFVGTGTTIVASEKENRSCYAMDIDPGYVAVTLERLKLMGLKPTLQ